MSVKIENNSVTQKIWVLIITLINNAFNGLQVAQKVKKSLSFDIFIIIDIQKFPQKQQTILFIHLSIVNILGES